jgi:hypothetical protein
MGHSPWIHRLSPVKILVFVSLTTLSGNVLAASLVDQVNICKQTLGFTNMPPNTDCFAPNTQSFVGALGRSPDTPARMNYFRLSAHVDAVLHCENVNENTDQLDPNFGRVLLLIHNRDSGDTCFFDRKPIDQIANPTATVVPTLDTANASHNSVADAFWQRPAMGHSDQEDCTGCHIASGPYLMGGSAASMAYFGLINNNHDTKDQRYSEVDFDLISSTGSAVLMVPNVFHGDDTNTCGGTCHNFIPTHQDAIGDTLARLADFLTGASLMPAVSQDSDYHWINRDTELDGTGDVETLSAVQQSYPQFF